MLAASAVQLTLGLETWDLSYFNHLLIYPGEYKNPQSGRYHKGETNLGGFMCFSWEDFLAGNKNPADKINLGLHEFAHALRFNGIKGDKADYFFDNYFPRWVACAVKEFAKMRKNKPSIFRKYGSVNINEFFSVVVETYFETPKEFASYFPELFQHTAILLNQKINDDGTVTLNCRKDLLNNTNVTLKKDYSQSIKHNLKYNGSWILSIGFFMVGLFCLPKNGHLYPSFYICFSIAVLLWLNLELRYTRLFFSGNQFRLEKGFLLLKGYKKITLPLSQLISLVAAYEHLTNDNGQTYKQLTAITVTHFKDDCFYEDELNCDVQQPDFDALCDELKENFIHVFIRD